MYPSFTGNKTIAPGANKVILILICICPIGQGDSNLNLYYITLSQIIEKAA
jgi:hypothetical protein